MGGYLSPYMQQLYTYMYLALGVNTGTTVVYFEYLQKKNTIYIMKGTASVEVFSMVMISSTFLFFPLHQESQFFVRGATI